MIKLLSAILLTVCAIPAFAEGTKVTSLEVGSQRLAPMSDQYYQFDFGSVWTNQAVYRDFNLNNAGPGDLIIYRMTMTSGDFSAVHSCPQVLYPRTYCPIQVRFMPWFEGLSRGRLQIETSSGLITLDFSGWGVR